MQAQFSLLCSRKRPPSGPWPHLQPWRRALLLWISGLGLALFALGWPMSSYANALLEPGLPSGSAILASLQRLGRVGTVLYVAAHPDDENSRLLAWLAGERGLRVVYLSLTRGDGGQNLIGSEQDELLGLLRTHELLAARAIDGGEQRFTRARDFGYSKTTAETLKIWGKEQVLADVVRVIRDLQPDAVVTRFTPVPPNHGHHMASAELAAEAFLLAGQGSYQSAAADLKPWRAARLLHNVTLFNRKIEDVRAPYRVDVGGYSPLTGRSWGELAANSRSQHKSQGFGVAAARGALPEFFELLAGSTPAGSDPFADLPSAWSRFAGGAAIDQQVAGLVAGHSVRQPHLSLPGLAKLRAALAALPADNSYRTLKLAEVDQLLVACAGLYLEARADQAEIEPGAPFAIRVDALLGLPAAVQLQSVQVEVEGQADGAASARAQPWAVALAVHASQTTVLTAELPATAQPTTPYWLRQPAQGGLYALPDRAALERPVDPPAIRVKVALQIQGVQLQVQRAVRYLWTDPVRGERTRAVEVAPPVTATPDRPVVVVPAQTQVTLQWQVARSLSQNTAQGNVYSAQRQEKAPAPATRQQATLVLQAPPGWQVEPARQVVELAAAGVAQTVAVQIRAQSAQAQAGELQAFVEFAGRRWSVQQHGMDYEHVPPLTVRKPAQVRLVPVQLQLGLQERGQRIGYIPGPGDRVAESLQAVGYRVTLLPEPRIAVDSLEEFGAIVVGVRALNAQPKLAAHLPKLMRWVQDGGRLLVQYQTNSRIGPLTVAMGPYPLEIGRDRVTDETAPLTWLDAASPLRSGPNALTEADFAGWVQERGLYFAKTWDPRYQAPLQLADPGEAPLSGALLVAAHGKGQFIYTGLAFFRQLPAGVPGAYRLFANLLGK